MELDIATKPLLEVSRGTEVGEEDSGCYVETAPIMLIYHHLPLDTTARIGRRVMPDIALIHSIAEVVVPNGTVPWKKRRSSRAAAACVDSIPQ